MTKDVTMKKFIPPLIATLFLGALFIKNAELAADFVKQGIESCFLTVIPSLFPLMVVAELLNECGAISCVGKTFGGFAARIFGISKGSAAAVFLGLLLGFPMGTKALTALYDRGEISGEELEGAIGFCGIPSFAFIVNAVGISLFCNRAIGLVLYFSALFSAIIAGILFAKRKKQAQKCAVCSTSRPKSFAEIVTGAISSATGSVVLLCAYVVFFSSVVGCVSKLFSLSSLGGAVIGAILELSTGAVSSASLGGLWGVGLCGFVIGWSGLSVHFQTAALVGERVRHYSTYLAMKLFQGLLCSVLSVAFAFFADIDLPGKTQYIPTFAPIFTPEYTAIILVAFFMCALNVCKRSAARRYGLL